MRIIEQGRLPGEREHIVRCLECQTKFAFKESEARRSIDERDGDALVVKCPTCRKDVWTSTMIRQARAAGIEVIEVSQDKARVPGLSTGRE